MSFKYVKALPYFKQLDAGFSLQSPRFSPGWPQVGFLVEKVALEQVFL
jgi:hypothetical protein